MEHVEQGNDGEVTEGTENVMNTSLKGSTYEPRR